MILLLTVLLSAQLSSSYAEKLKQYLPGDCYISPYRYTFVWIIPLDKTNVNTASEVINVAKDVCKSIFKEVQTTGQSDPFFTALIMFNPNSSFNESTNINNSQLLIRTFVPQGAKRTFISFDYRTEYNVIYPGYSTRGMDALGLSIPIKHKGTWWAIRPKDRELFHMIWLKLGKPEYIESYDSYSLMSTDITKWPRFMQEFPPEQ